MKDKKGGRERQWERRQERTGRLICRVGKDADEKKQELLEI